MLYLRNIKHFFVLYVFSCHYSYINTNGRFLCTPKHVSWQIIFYNVSLKCSNLNIFITGLKRCVFALVIVNIVVTDFIGEDRWLSCLLLKAGWLLDYCSLAEVSTLCPETFDGFFLQRRHWIMTTFANTCCLIKDFWNIRHSNCKLSVFYFAYLIATVFFVIIR